MIPQGAECEAALDAWYLRDALAKLPPALSRASARMNDEVMKLTSWPPGARTAPRAVTLAWNAVARPRRSVTLTLPDSLGWERFPAVMQVQLLSSTLGYLTPLEFERQATAA